MVTLAAHASIDFCSHS